VKELQQRIKTYVQDVYRVRTGEEIQANGKFDLGGMSNSMTIARTEMGIITAQTRFEAFEDEGIEIWEWVAAKDDKTRDAHNMRDGKKARVGDPFPFPVEGQSVTYPRDPSGALADIINCRCVAVAAE
jgi:SPP1 gp7 family putative phage head morphogenesis protein